MLSENTVKSHVQRILSKLRLPNRLWAVILAYEVGLVSAGERNALTPREGPGEDWLL
jgi:hypothetical protein